MSQSALAYLHRILRQEFDGIQQQVMAGAMSHDDYLRATARAVALDFAMQKIEETREKLQDFEDD